MPDLATSRGPRSIGHGPERDDGRVVNDRRLLRAVLSALDGAGLSVLAFGGWAEELCGVIPARTHRDIDLLVIDPDDTALENFLRARIEVREKRFSHKRAFVMDGVPVDPFIVRRQYDDYVTCFWDQLRWMWPSNLVANVAGLPVASEFALVSYRENWASIRAFCAPTE